NFGGRTLQNANNRRAEVAIGHDSLAYGYGHKISMDDDTYHRLKLVQGNKDTGEREVSVAPDSRDIATGGRRQPAPKVDDKLNSAQIKQMLDQLRQLKNREKKTFTIGAIGDLGIRAGVYVPIMIKELGINQHFLVDECTHKWDGGEHTMQLTLRVV